MAKANTEYHHTKGPMEKRLRTDLRMSERVLKMVDEQCRLLGIPKNAFYTMGACLLSAKLSRCISGKVKRDRALQMVEDLFRETIEKVK